MITLCPGRDAVTATIMAGLIGCALAGIAPTVAQTVAPVSDAGPAQPIPAVTIGRVVADEAGGTMLRQWPGTYWETRFDGPACCSGWVPGRLPRGCRWMANPLSGSTIPQPACGGSTGWHRERTICACRSWARRRPRPPGSAASWRLPVPGPCL